MPADTSRGWTISIDTGGTFTDVIAVDAEGELRRLKVLSDASVRAQIVEVQSPTSLRLGHSFPDAILGGTNSPTWWTG